MIFFYISLSTYFCYQILKYRQGLVLLNEANGSLKKYSKSLIKNKKELFFTPELLAIILIVIAVNTDAKITGICFVIFYTLMFLYMFRKKKEKLVLNKSNVILIVILLILFLLLDILFYFNDEMLNSGFLIFDATWIYYIVFAILSYFSYVALLIAEIIIKPFELIFKKKSKHKTKKRK